MYLNKLSLTQFKNYQAQTFDFTEKVTGISGLNGMGKTNLLDAIYYLCFTRSYFSKSDNANILFGMDGFRLEGKFTETDEGTGEEQTSTIKCILRNPGKKEVYFNDNLYEKFSMHIGRIPTVMIAPDDVEIILGGSEERRKFIDTVLSQIDKVYLQKLILYNRLLLQKNTALKNFAETRQTDHHLLDVLDLQIIPPALYIHEARQNFMEELLPVIKNFYHDIAANREEINIEYISQLNDSDFKTLLAASRDKDLIYQRSLCGVHKDDLAFLLDEKVFKTIASQGQRKSLLFALKLAEFELLASSKGYAPLLLLDDVFEKLDDRRMQNLLNYVCNENDGQVFITDTSGERLRNALESIGVEAQYITID